MRYREVVCPQRDRFPLRTESWAEWESIACILELPLVKAEFSCLCSNLLETETVFGSRDRIIIAWDPIGTLPV